MDILRTENLKKYYGGGDALVQLAVERQRAARREEIGQRDHGASSFLGKLDW